VAGAFAADPRQVAGRELVLVDDVVTTGATAQAAAAALLAAGAARVTVVALARAE
jgi:predicted amidophosphoribosyltransferase